MEGVGDNTCDAERDKLDKAVDEFHDVFKRLIPPPSLAKGGVSSVVVGQFVSVCGFLVAEVDNAEASKTNVSTCFDDDTEDAQD